MFDKTIMRLVSGKVRLWHAYTQLQNGLFIPHIESLMDDDRGWNDLHLQAKLQEYLKEDGIRFREVIPYLEQNLDYFRSKLSVAENFLVS